jgi:adenylate cyclase
MSLPRQGLLGCHGRDEPADRRRIARQVIARMRVAVPLANGVGGLIVFVYFAWAFPAGDDSDVFATTAVNALVGVVYFAIATALALWLSERGRPPLKRWTTDDAPPAADERQAILRLPARMVGYSALNWAMAVPIFFLVNLDDSLALASDVAGAIAIAGLSACAAVYLVAERITRPALAYVLDPRATTGARSLGIKPRIILTWALLSGVPLIGIASIPLGRLPQRPEDLAVPIVFVVVVTLVIGLFGMKAVAHAIATPVRSLRDAMDQVGEGRTDVEVQVDDASEIGRLQAGFNAMVDGLRERERLRELFGRQVGDDVARAALEQGVTLGGEQRTVSVLFVDVIGSTGLATREAPERVVELLNEFFAAVVHTVDEHGGLVNKFEGDGALCVFGAPVERDDHASAVLAAARELRGAVDLLCAGGSPLDAAIGVSCGMVVAGHVGAEQRYEYTVIGDPVNEASRLCELAKSYPTRVLASATTVEQADAGERRRWTIDGEVRLRGRSATTRLAFPSDVAGARASAA